MEDRNIKTRELIRLEGILNATLSQIKNTHEALQDIVGKYNYEESSDKDKEIIDRIEDILQKTDEVWTSLILIR